MINNLIQQVEGVFGLATTTRRKRTTRPTTSKNRAYSAPARRTKRKVKRITRRSY